MNDPLSEPHFNGAALALKMFGLPAMASNGVLDSTRRGSVQFGEDGGSGQNSQVLLLCLLLALEITPEVTDMFWFQHICCCHED